MISTTAERRTLRDILAGIVGALGMTAIIGFAQWLDAQDAARVERARIAQIARLRADAADAGYREGLDRIRCLGGLRIDTRTGRPLDVGDHR